jgi:ABC-type amino acid transport substrate-binding protein
MMKPYVVFSLVLISLGLFTAGCGSDTPEPVPTAEPTIELVATETEPAPTVEPTIELVATETEATVVSEIEPIRVGVFTNSVPPLAIIEGESYSGFEIDIATEIVTRLRGSEALIEWVPITSQERFSSLADGQIDMLVRGVLHTVSREEMALFSGGYLLSGNSFLVFQEDGFTSVADLDGKNVAVVENMEEGLNQAADMLGYTFNPVVAPDIDEARGSLGFDRAEAIFHDWLLFASFLDKNVHAVITDGSLLAPIGVAFPLSEPDFRDEVDIVLNEMISDGTWQSLFDKWIGIAVPWNVDEMFAYPPLDR